MVAVAQREDIKATFLDAAERLFQRYGYKKTTVEDIAQEAGLSRATVYLHFKSKEEIALVWADRNNQRLRAELEKIAQRAEPPTRRVQKVLLTRVLYRFDLAQPYTQSLDELLTALRLPLLAQREHNHEEEAAILVRILAEGEAQGEFAFTDALDTARLLILATNSLLPYSLSARQLGERAEIERRTARLIQLLLEGIHQR